MLSIRIFEVHIFLLLNMNKNYQKAAQFHEFGHSLVIVHLSLLFNLIMFFIYILHARFANAWRIFNHSFDLPKQLHSKWTGNSLHARAEILTTI